MAKGEFPLSALGRVIAGSVLFLALCGPSVADQPSIFYAAIANDLGIAKHYAASGEPINISDKYGRTPLMFAAEHGNKELVEFLLKSGADPALKTREGFTAFSFARRAEVKVLLKQAMGAGKSR